MAIHCAIDRTDAYVRESSVSMDYVANNQYFRHIVTTGMNGFFLHAAKSINGALPSHPQSGVHARSAGAR